MIEPIAVSSFSLKRIRTSWSWVQENFLPELKILAENNMLSETGPGEQIWSTRSKFVLKVPLSTGGFAVVKKYRKIAKPIKYLLRLSPCGLEACNFARFKKLGIPLPELLAVGETRKNFHLKTAFIITRFAEGFRDGRDFAPQGKFRDKSTLLKEFLRRNVIELARCHDAHIIHRGFTPANLMWKELAATDINGNRLELLWIDLASCRRCPYFIINRLCAKELARLFTPLELSEELQRELIALYCATRQKDPPQEKMLCKKFFK